MAGVHLDAQQNATLAQLEDDINEQIGGFYQTLDETSERSVFRSRMRRACKVPQRLRDLMARQAKDAGLEGWQILCNERNAKAILEFADDRRLRELSIRPTTPGVFIRMNSKTMATACSSWRFCGSRKGN